MHTAITARTHQNVAADRGQREPVEAFGERLRVRDPDALERFFDLYFDAIHSRVSRLVGNAEDAEDLTQDIFLRLHRALPSFDPARPLDPWVHTIVMYGVRDHWRSRPRESGLDNHEHADASAPNPARPEASLKRRECDEQFARAVHRLPLGMRCVLLLRIYDGLRFNTIAEILRITPEAVRKRYSRSLNRLRASLTLDGVEL